MTISRQLSEGTCELISSLAPRRGLVPDLPWRARHRELTVLEIGQRGEVAALPWLLDLTLDANQRVVAAAQSVVASLLSTVEIEDLAWLDEHVRRIGSRGGAWASLSPASVERQPLESDSLRFLLTFHTNGRVRQLAIRRLTAPRSGAELPYLLLRLNDWVPEVRDEARKQVEARLIPSFTTPLVRCLPLLRGLQQRLRGEHEAILDRAIGVITASTDEPPRALVEQLASDRTANRRWSFTVGSRLTGRALSRFLAEARKSTDPTLRQRAVRLTLETEPEELRREMLPALLEDRFSPIRIAALEAAHTLAPEEVIGLLEHALLDRRPTVRRYAAAVLQSRHHIEVAPICRRALASDRRRIVVAALEGLRDVGGPGDVEAALAALHSAFPSVRAAALGLLATHGSAAQREALFAALHDPSPAVAREAATAVRKLDLQVSVSWLAEAMQSAVHHHTRLAHLRLVDCLPRWSRPTVLIRLCGGPDRVLACDARLRLARWLRESRHVGLSPTRDQLREIQHVVHQHSACLLPEELEELHLMLRQLG